MAIGITYIYRTKNREFTLLYVFLHEFFAALTTFWRISAKIQELLASILCCSRPYCALGIQIVMFGVNIVLLASILCYWCSWGC
jgi:hypothetical protein